MATAAMPPLTASGGPAVDFKLQDTYGNTVSLSSYSGKQPVFMIFWTTWCPYCREALKKINSMYSDLKKENWEILAINVQESSGKVKNYLNNSPLSFKVLLDSDGGTARSYEVMGVPTYLLIDKSGVVIFRDSYFPSEELKK